MSECVSERDRERERERVCLGIGEAEVIIPWRWRTPEALIPFSQTMLTRQFVEPWPIPAPNVTDVGREADLT